MFHNVPPDYQEGRFLLTGKIVLARSGVLGLVVPVLDVYIRRGRLVIPGAIVAKVGQPRPIEVEQGGVTGNMNGRHIYGQSLLEFLNGREALFEVRLTPNLGHQVADVRRPLTVADIGIAARWRPAGPHPKVVVRHADRG